MINPDIGSREARHFFSEDDWIVFRELVGNLAAQDPRVIGVLAVGSLMQPPGLPDGHFDSLPGKLGEVYDIIRRPERRKFGYSSSSDLDIWICTEDVSDQEEAINRKGIQLLGMAATNKAMIGTPLWAREKWERFSEHYKNPLLYQRPDDAEPWMAAEFKNNLDSLVERYLPDVAARINTNLTKTIPGSFFEVRAFPESAFHLRPDEHTIDGYVERMPFPRIADPQWISESHNAHILYTNDRVSIYPFRPNGRVLGQSIKTYIQEQGKQGEDGGLIYEYGAMLLKPDAVQGDQVDVILRKLAEALPRDCKIIDVVRLEEISDEQLREMYYSLDSTEVSFNQVRDYIKSGPSVLVLIEGNGRTNLLQLLNRVKGKRPGDWPLERLLAGRREDATIRDLIPLPGDEEQFAGLVDKILARQKDPSIRFTPEEYAYYCRNLVHTPGDERELRALLAMASQ